MSIENFLQHPSVFQHPSVLQYQYNLQLGYAICISKLYENACKTVHEELLCINPEKTHNVAHEIACINERINELIKINKIRIKLATMRSLHKYAAKVMNAQVNAGRPMRKYRELPTSENLQLIAQQALAHASICSGNCPTCLGQVWKIFTITFLFKNTIKNTKAQRAFWGCVLPGCKTSVVFICI